MNVIHFESKYIGFVRLMTNFRFSSIRGLNMFFVLVFVNFSFFLLIVPFGLVRSQKHNIVWSKNKGKIVGNGGAHFRGNIFSPARPFYERAVNNLDRSMHRSLWV